MIYINKIIIVLTIFLFSSCKTTEERTSVNELMSSVNVLGNNTGENATGNCVSPKGFVLQTSQECQEGWFNVSHEDARNINHAYTMEVHELHIEKKLAQREREEKLEKKTATKTNNIFDPKPQNTNKSTITKKYSKKIETAEDRVLRKKRADFLMTLGSALMDGEGVAGGLKRFNDSYSSSSSSFKNKTEKPQTACFLETEATGGFNKICFYDCTGTVYALNLDSSTKLCPLTINK